MIQNILIELDALLDTRLGVLSQLYPAQTARLMDSDFRNRVSDEFSYYAYGINDALFKKAYAERSIGILSKSLMTEVPLLVKGIILNELEKITMGDPVITDIEVTINTFPYQLPVTHMEDYRAILSTILDIPYSKLKMDYIQYCDMDAAYLKAADWGLMIIYNYEEWMMAAFQVDTPPEGNPTTTVLVPKLLRTRDDIRELERINDPDLPTKDPFQLQKLMLAKCFGLDHVHPQTFSLAHPSSIGM